MDLAGARKLLQDRLLQVEERIAAACARAGRKRADVALIAVTKSIPTEVAALLPQVGLLNLGENRPQELWKKAAALPRSIRWHLIGHLQRNKIDATLPVVELIHAVDSERLLHALEAEAARQGRVAQVLLEVNVSGEESKQGFTLNAATQVAPLVQSCKHVVLQGLMTMAPFQSAENCRPVFASLRELSARLRTILTAPHGMQHLSMGMTNDFEVAIEEGATLIRLGTALFEDMAP